MSTDWLQGFKGIACIKDDSLAIRSATRTGGAKITTMVPAAIKGTMQKGVLIGKQVVQLR